jgi:NTP pyrophosphatase (non-canonical NTP hydrolase)
MASQARHVTEPYQERDTPRFGRPRNLNELVPGVVRDARNASDVDEALEHGLADCPWSIIALADAANGDVEAALTRTANDISHSLDAR